MAYDLGIALVRLALSFHVFTNERRGKKGKYEKMKSAKKERITIFHIKAERWIIVGLSGMRWSAIGDDGRNDDGKKNARIKGGR